MISASPMPSRDVYIVALQGTIQQELIYDTTNLSLVQQRGPCLNSDDWSTMKLRTDIRPDQHFRVITEQEWVKAIKSQSPIFKIEPIIRLDQIDSPIIDQYLIDGVDFNPISVTFVDQASNKTTLIVSKYQTVGYLLRNLSPYSCKDNRFSISTVCQSVLTIITLDYESDDMLYFIGVEDMCQIKVINKYAKHSFSKFAIAEECLKLKNFHWDIRKMHVKDPTSSQKLPTNEMLALFDKHMKCSLENISKPEKNYPILALAEVYKHITSN